MKLLKALLDVLNGKKMNTGTVMVIAVIVIKQFLGVDEAEATAIATNIMLGVGGAMTLWGYIHKLIKGTEKK